MARDNALRFTWSTVNTSYSSVTLTASSAVLTAVTPAVAPPNGTVAILAGVGGITGGIAASTPYYVVNSSGASFGLSTTLNGTALVPTGTTATGQAMTVQNVSPVSTALGGRSAGVKLTSTVNNYFQSFSDGLNVTRFRTQIADISLMVSQTVQSAIVGDPPLQSSTSEGNYYLRTSVQPAGMFGPAPCQIVVQGAGVNSPTSPVPGDIDWLQVSNIGSCPANISIANLTVATATGGVTVNSGSITPGQTVMPVATFGGLTANVQYLVGPGNILYRPDGVALSGLTTTQVGNVYVGSFSAFTTVNAASIAIGSSNFTFDALPSAGCTFVFLTINGGTATVGSFAVNTPYYVVPTTTAGQVGLSATYNGTAIAQITTAITSGTGFCTNQSAQPYVYVGNTVTGNVIQAVANVGGTLAVPHGLEVGDVVYGFSGTPGTIALDVPYYVNTVPSSTTFTLSTTINGATTTVTNGTSLVFAVARASKLLNVQVDKTIRPWMRMAVNNQNTAYAQVGYLTVNFADISVGRDNSLVN
jgi:hypothetical protein